MTYAELTLTVPEDVTAAVERGYYDTPRRTSLSDLADHLGVAKSTCSEVLHRAEERAMEDLVEGRDGGPTPRNPAPGD